MSLPFLRQSALLLETLHPGSLPGLRPPADVITDTATSEASRARARAPPKRAANAVAAHADAIAPHADVIPAHADAKAARADAVAAHADVIPASADVIPAHADAIAARADRVEAQLLEAALGLAPPEQLLATERVDEVAPSPSRTWWQHFGAERGGWRGAELSRGELGAAPFQLMRLPRNYHELFQRYVKARCQLCKKVPAQPVLCLVCGAFLCGNARSTCCRVDSRGECYRHAAECGLGVGVFLFLRRTTVTLLRHGRHTVWLSPYLDAHDEEDIDLRRGKPLFLSEERYTALTEMVASMGMDHDSQVLARTVRRPPQVFE